MENDIKDLFKFPFIETAKVKDAILEVLCNEKQPIGSIDLYNTIKPKDVFLERFNEYLKDIWKDEFIHLNEVTGGRSIVKIVNKGKVFLDDGGYTKIAQDKLNESFKEQLEEDKRQTKLNLEIENLRASISNYKRTRRISITALIISIISIIVSVLLKIL